jgi:hypothetical protein
MTARHLSLVLWCLMGVLLGYAWTQRPRRSEVSVFPPVPESSGPSLVSRFESSVTETTLNEDALSEIETVLGNTLPAHGRIDVKLAWLSLHENPVLLDELIALLKEGRASNRIVEAAFFQWATEDPEGAANSLMREKLDSFLPSAIQGTFAAWAKHDAEVALAYVRDHPTWPIRSNALSKIFAELAKENPQRALAELTQVRSLTHGAEDDVFRSIVRTWADQDLNGLLDSVTQLDSWPRTDLHFLGAILGTLEEVAPERSIGFALQFPSEDPDGFLLSKAASNRWTQSIGPGFITITPDRVLEVLSVVHTERLTPSVAQELGESTWLGSSSKVAALLPEGDVRLAFWEGLIKRHAPTDPSAAAKQMEQLPEGEHRIRSASRLMTSWAHNDAVQAAHWLTQLPSSSSRDVAVRAFALELAHTDLEGAMAWAGTITDQETRTEILTKLD